MSCNNGISFIIKLMKIYYFLLSLRWPIKFRAFHLIKKRFDLEQTRFDL